MFAMVARKVFGSKFRFFLIATTGVMTGPPESKNRGREQHAATKRDARMTMACGATFFGRESTTRDDFGPFAAKLIVTKLPFGSPDS
jgi:hypothetical protein